MTQTLSTKTEPTWGVPTDRRLARPHARRLALLVGLTIGAAIPMSLTACLIAGRLAGWDPIFIARAANVCGMVFLAGMLLGPLLMRSFPLPERLRGFVLVWFTVSPFFNAVWQLPLILFKSTITEAPVTQDNLPRFISWWGYGSVDSHYGRVSSFMVASEMGWLVAMTISLVGLAVLLRGRARLGYLVLGVGAALQAYNASFYILENGIVDGYDNVATDSLMGPLLYAGLGALWPLAALTASIICLRYVFVTAPEQRDA